MRLAVAPRRRSGRFGKIGLCIICIEPAVNLNLLNVTSWQGKKFLLYMLHESDTHTILMCIGLPADR